MGDPPKAAADVISAAVMWRLCYEAVQLHADTRSAEALCEAGERLVAAVDALLAEGWEAG